MSYNIPPQISSLKKSAKLASRQRAHHPSPEEEATLLSLFNEGRYSEGIVLAQKITELFPQHGFGWKVLGALLSAQGNNADALLPLQQAAQLLAQDQQAQSNLGVVLAELNRFSEAEVAYRRALAIDPDCAEYHCYLGATLKLQGRIAEAEACLRQAIALKPDYAEAQFNLGVILYDQECFVEAEAAYLQALACDQDYAEAHLSLAATLRKQGRLLEAEEKCRHTLLLKPDYAEAYFNLGTTLKLQGRVAEAEASYRQAIVLMPSYIQAQFSLGTLLHEQENFIEADTAYLQALVYKPDFAEIHLHLAISLHDQGRLSEAKPRFQQALMLKPDYPEAENDLGALLLNQSCLLEAEICFRRALALKPDFEDAFSNLLFLMNYDPDRSGESIFAAYREYDERFCQSLRGTWRAHSNNRASARRLRIGYVSPDFYAHSVLYFLEPLLAQHDKQAFEIYAYAELSREDETTTRYKNRVDHWIPTLGLSDEALAERIRADEIDILVDLAGHTAHNRLQVFARKPAPVSISWLGYGYTTGLTAIDYFLTDAASTPPGSECVFSEIPWRLATPAYVYRPAVDMGPVGPLPAREQGHITFGTLTRAIRINHRTIRVWSAILKRVEGSRLAVNSRNFQDPAQQEALAARFAEHGILREQLYIGYHSPAWDVLRSFDIGLDCIGLDCFPHNSGTTLFETLYMGVPYLTLAGRPSVGRLGSSILEGIGHPEWIASSEEEYIEKAVALATDIPRLAELRAGLRQEMETGPLMDEVGFTRKVEAAYQEMFRHWAAGQSPHQAMGSTAPLLTLDEACEKAVAYHRAGQFDAAEQIYRAIVQVAPQHPTANHFLGLLSVQLDRPEAALPYLLAALEGNPTEADYWLAYLDALLLAGQTDEARQVLELGRQQGLQGEEADRLAARLQVHLPAMLPGTNTPPPSASLTPVPVPEKIVSHEASLPSTEEEAALVLAFNQGRYSEGIALARTMTEHFPEHGFGWKLLGALLSVQGDSANALLPLQKAVQLLPQDERAQTNLGLALTELDRLPEAEDCHRRALEINPEYANAYNNLGTALKLQGRLAEAEASYQQAVLLKPDYSAAYNNLGSVIRMQDRPAEAEIHFRHALEYNPDSPTTHYNLANTLHELNRLDEAVLSFRQALVANPKLAEAHFNLSVTLNNLAISLQNQGFLPEAETCYRQALAEDADCANVFSNLLFLLSHAPDIDAILLFAEHCRFGEQFETPLHAFWPQHSNTRDPDRCLQVGFVSADLRNHAIANFIEPVLTHLAQFPTLALHAYYTHTVEDGVTRRLRTYLKHWHAVAALSDADLAQKIREDGIDILIDLSGHTAHNRLLTFARKPAPVQASWMGYPGTTGLQAMDYYIADRHYLPPDQFANQFTEKLAYLPASSPFLPFKAAPPVNALPALKAGYLTFGSFNRLGKLSASTIALWSSLLRALPEAKMLLGGMPMEGKYDKLIDRFAQEGIARDRLSFHPRSSMDAYLALHHQVDICLDTTPYAGGTTTLHALWMGVPTLSVAGLTPAGRTGASILAHVGLEDFVAQDTADFVDKGVSWAKNLTALAELRAGLRARCDQSATRHPEVISANLERALRIMWQRWCTGLPAESFVVADERSGATTEIDASPVSSTPSLTLDEVCDKAIAYQRAGQFDAAEQVYRAILQAAPQHPTANHFLGLLIVQLEQPKAALPYLLTALEANQTEADYWLAYLDALLLAGQTEQARQVLELGLQQGLKGEEVDRLAASLPVYLSATNAPPPSTSLLQVPVPEKIAPHEASVPSPEEEAALVLTFNQRYYNEGIALARSMTKNFPLYGFGWKVLGALLSAQGQSADALEAMQESVQLSPDDEQAQTNLGLVLGELNRLSEAEACHRRALALNPQFAPAHHNLGATLKQQGQIVEAEACYRAAISLKSDYAKAHLNLGITLYEQGRFSEAEAACLQALVHKPDSHEAFLYLGVSLHQQEGRIAEAEACYRTAISLKPDYAKAHRELSVIFYDQGLFAEAKLCYRQVLTLESDCAEAENNLAYILSTEGCFFEAESCLRRALALNPGFEHAFCNLLFLLNYDPDKSGEAIFAAYRDYDERFCRPLCNLWRAHTNSRETARRLKIGYVSPNFNLHSVRHFLEPLLARHDRKLFEVYAYAELKQEDEATARYKERVDHWIPTRGLSDEALAERIRLDEIDILVDLAGHTMDKRLPVFAYKPAPVSLSWLGYGYTTGLTAIDYFLTDEASAPAGSEGLFSETLWRLPTPAYVYRPAVGMGPVGPLPADEQGLITFGTLTRAIRINHRTIRVWSEILKRVEGSRLAVNSLSFRDTALQETLAARFAAHGIRREQLEMGFHSPPWDALRSFDIGLDCFPHNSGATLFETLYMGVPYITLAGRPSVGRLGSSILEGLGHPEWIARSEAEYIEKAVALASDLPRLAKLRAGLRQEMETGPLMDEVGFARKVETAYREMWQQWCAQAENSR